MLFNIYAEKLLLANVNCRHRQWFY